MHPHNTELDAQIPGLRVTIFDYSTEDGAGCELIVGNGHDHNICLVLFPGRGWNAEGWDHGRKIDFHAPMLAQLLDRIERLLDQHFTIHRDDFQEVRDHMTDLLTRDRPASHLREVHHPTQPQQPVP